MTTSAIEYEVQSGTFHLFAEPSTIGSYRNGREAALKYLTCGQMARLNGVSERTLRYYQKEGVLEPFRVDEETGFRYYDITQSTKLSMISHLQAMGFSLDDIRDLDEGKSIAALQSKAESQLEIIQAKLRECEIAQRLAVDLIDNCENSLNKPILNQIMLESLPERSILEFDIPVEDAALNQQSTLTSSEQWEWIVSHVKRQILERDWPVSLFRNVGYLIPQQRVEQPDSWKAHAFVLVDETFGECYEQARALSGGSYLTVYFDQGYASDGSAIDDNRISRLLEYAKAKGFEVRGELFCEPICRYQRFFHGNLESFHRYCLPVR